VCVPWEWDTEDIERSANLRHPTGVTPWKVANQRFRNGQSNPCPCEKKPKIRMHYLLSC